jgi:hypothetical protein
VVGWLFIGAPVQSAPDALNRAGSLQALKPAPRQPSSFGLRERERRRQSSPRRTSTPTICIG